MGLVAGLVGTGLLWLAWDAARRWGPKPAESLGPFPKFSVAVLMVVLGVPAGCIGCSMAYPPSRAQAGLQFMTVLEVPLRSATDHADLFAILRRVAREDGLHVDDGTEQWIEFRRETAHAESAELRTLMTKTIYASAYRGKSDNDLEIVVDDGGHQGRAWLEFLRGQKPDRASSTRERLIAALKQRWPDARDIPVSPNGGLPRAEDLVWSDQHYVIRP